MICQAKCCGRFAPRIAIIGANVVTAAAKRKRLIQPTDVCDAVLPPDDRLAQ